MPPPPLEPPVILQNTRDAHRNIHPQHYARWTYMHAFDRVLYTFIMHLDLKVAIFINSKKWASHWGQKWTIIATWSAKYRVRSWPSLRAEPTGEGKSHAPVTSSFMCYQIPSDPPRFEHPPSWAREPGGSGGNVPTKLWALGATLTHFKATRRTCH